MDGEISDGLLHGSDGYDALVGDGVAAPSECCPNTFLPLRKVWLICMPPPLAQWRNRRGRDGIQPFRFLNPRCILLGFGGAAPGKNRCFFVQKHIFDVILMYFQLFQK